VGGQLELAVVLHHAGKADLRGTKMH
jgi:hypothetical protein